MPDISTILLFVVASIALLAKPGHTTVLVIARSLAQGRGVALPLVLGAGLGDLVTASVSLAVAGALLAATATAFTIVKAVGAIYLIWFGIRLYKSEPVLPEITTDPSPRTDDREALSAFRDGFLITIFNPKGILFFLAFVLQFIDPARSYPMQATFFVFTFVVLAMLNGTLYALGADRASSLIASADALRSDNRANGFKVAAAGLRALFTRRPSA